MRKIIKIFTCMLLLGAGIIQITVTAQQKNNKVSFQTGYYRFFKVDHTMMPQADGPFNYFGLSYERKVTGRLSGFVQFIHNPGINEKNLLTSVTALW